MHLPEDVLLIAVSVDVQAKYVACLTAGWTETMEMWALEWEQFDGDPRDPAVLQSVVTTAHALRFEHLNGDVPVHLVGIDSQFLTDYVDAAVRYGNKLRGHVWCYATAGVGGRGNTGEGLLIQKHDVRDARGRRGRRPLLINTDIAKDEFAAMLAVEQPGPGYVHIPKRMGRAFIQQLTAEERREKLDADGAVVGFEWKPKGGARNEGLDCSCIALALWHKVTKQQWLKLLTDRHGELAGIERWRARYPGERISGIDDPPRRRDPFYGEGGRHAEINRASEGQPSWIRPRGKPWIGR